jgi:hypothetical protein
MIECILFDIVFIPFAICVIFASISNFKQHKYLKHADRHKEYWYVTGYFKYDYTYTDTDGSEQSDTAYKMNLISPDGKNTMAIGVEESEFEKLPQGAEVGVTVCRDQNDRVVECSNSIIRSKLADGIGDMILGIIGCLSTLWISISERPVGVIIWVVIFVATLILVKCIINKFTIKKQR